MSLNFYENQITGLLGHNGAGKVFIHKFKELKRNTLFTIFKNRFERQLLLSCFVVIILNAAF